MCTSHTFPWRRERTVPRSHLQCAPVGDASLTKAHQGWRHPPSAPRPRSVWRPLLLGLSDSLHIPLLRGTWCRPSDPLSVYPLAADVSDQGSPCFPASHWASLCNRAVGEGLAGDRKARAEELGYVSPLCCLCCVPAPGAAAPARPHGAPSLGSGSHTSPPSLWA